MLLNRFLFILIYFTSNQGAKEVHIPLCAAWNSTGTVIAGTKNGTSGANETLLYRPTAIVVDENDTIYVVDSGNNRLMKYANGLNIGQQMNISTDTSDGELINPGDIATDENDTMYVNDSSNNRLMKYESGSNIGQGVNVRTATNVEKLFNPQDIAIDKSGVIYISDTGNNRIVRWTLDPLDIKVLVSVNSPVGIYLDEARNDLYVVKDEKNPAVMRYDLKSLKYQQVAGGGYPQPNPQILSSLYGPIGIHVREDQKIFIAESGAYRITEWLPKRKSGRIVAGTESYGSTLSQLYGPTSIILDDTGTMYITDMNNRRILRWPNNTGQGECLLGCSTTNTTNATELIYPYDATFDSKLNFLVVERDVHRVKRFNFYFEKKCMLQYCRPPIISIEDHPSDHIRSQSMTFYITAKLDCYIWLTTDMKCSITASFPGDRLRISTTKLNTLVNTFLVPDSFNLTIPSFSLAVGTYEFFCTITMTATGRLSTITTTLQIIRSPILITLLPLGKSGITLGYQQQYTFYPNVSSNDDDDSYRQNMRFVYYCRKYPNFNYTMVKGIRSSIDGDSKDPEEGTCFNLTVLPESFVYDNDENRSSLTIMSGSLQINQTYEFYVEMYNDQGLVDKSDAVLVQIESKDSFFVEISTVFDMFTLDEDYQLLNPSTQIRLQSSCRDPCTNAAIQWKIYTGTMNNNSIIQWAEYIYPNTSLNQWFYGINSSSFTATHQLFASNPSVNYWQFVSIYTDKDKQGSGLLQLKTNHPPSKQFCSIDPMNGSTSELFTVTCQNWTDLDGIKDYFLHVISTKSEIIMSIAHSMKPVFSVYLPSGDPKSSYNLSLIIHVRDGLGAWTESDIMGIKVEPDERIVNETLTITENSHDLIDNLLLNGDRNELINSFSTILNQMASSDQEALMNNSQVRISELIISTFDTTRAELSTTNVRNASFTFIKNLNRRSTIREYFLSIYENSSIPTTIEDIIILSSTIDQLTDTTSEWTQKSLSIASKLCSQLAKSLYNISRHVTVEQVTLVVNSVAKCNSNIFTGVNAPLQGRGFVFDQDLNKDLTSSSTSESDYDEYVDYELLAMGIPDCNYTRLKTDQGCKETVIDDSNSSVELHYHNLRLYHQKLLAMELRAEIEGTIFYLAKSIRRHLNILQEFPIVHAVLRMLVEQIYETNLEEKLIDLSTRNASIYLPKKLTFPSSEQLGIRTSLLPLAPAGGYEYVNLSTALTLSVLNDDDKELQINTTVEFPIEMFIPRDINVPIPIFFEQIMETIIPPKRGTFQINRQFFIYFINITQMNPNLTISIHFELKPSTMEIPYSIIYKFDQVPAYNSTHISIDGSTRFCPQNLVEDMDYYTYYLDNIKTTGHKSLLLGIRELGEKEKCSMDSLPQITDEPYSFLSNYSVRIYSSGCYYLDDKGLWKSDGMKVGPKTNFEHTHCYSNHA